MKSSHPGAGPRQPHSQARRAFARQAGTPAAPRRCCPHVTPPAGGAEQNPAAPGAQRGGAAARSHPAPPSYIHAGLKTHAPGQHDYPQFLADWSKLLTERGARRRRAAFPAARGAGHRRRARHLQGRRRLPEHGRSRDARRLPAARRRPRQHPRRAVRPGSRAFARHRRRRQEARRGELHARSRRPLHRSSTRPTRSCRG